MQAANQPVADPSRRLLADGGLHDAGDTPARRAVVLNPESGDGTHVEATHELAAEYGYTVYETEHEGHGVDRTREAIRDGAEVVAACGGDGTVNEVARGIDAADALEDVTLGVLPGGTGNNFSLNIGVESIPQGFEVLEAHRTREVDVGVAGDRLFLNSCVAGLTAQASAETQSDLKERFGLFAYLVNTLQALPEFEHFELTLATDSAADPLWEGAAVSVLVGNARRVGEERVVQANMEDGLLDVTIIEAMPAPELLGTAAVFRLFDENPEKVTRLQTPSLDVVVAGVETATFSLDGEVLETDRLSASVRANELTLCVGDAYEPTPDESV